MAKSIPPVSQRVSAQYDTSGDSEDLQSLFDSIASSSGRDVVGRELPVDDGHVIDDSGDSPELQALFDRVAAQVAETASACVVRTPSAAPSGQTSPAEAEAHPPHHDIEAARAVFERLGRMTRGMHEALRELAYDKALTDTERAIPDVYQRLARIAQATEQVTDRVLGATGSVNSVQTGLSRDATGLSARWEKVFSNQLSPTDFKSLAMDTQTFLGAVPKQVDVVNSQLTNLAGSQGLQDVAAQIIRALADLVQQTESQLVSVLVDVMPVDVRGGGTGDLSNDPVIQRVKSDRMPMSPEQVNDVLEHLGF